MKLTLSEFQTEDYRVEHLFDSEENLELIKNFSVPNNATGLENYLKNFAADDERKKNARTYLVKDNVSDEILCYFSLRNGLVTTISEMSKEKFDTMPAIELSNFAINGNYRKNHPNSYRLGTMVFYDFILPLVEELSNFSGLNTLYIYALPDDHLISHYETMGFERLPAHEEQFVHHHIKPEYDENCIFMSQVV